MSVARPPKIVRLIRRDLDEQVALFESLWPGYDSDDDIVPPHRQRTSLNKLRGFALFLGMPAGKGTTFGAALRTLRDWQRRIGALRDVDVTRQWVARCRAEATPDAAAAAERLDDELRQRRLALLGSIRTDARGLPGADTRIAMAQVRAGFLERLDEVAAAGPFDHRPPLRIVAAPWLTERELLLTTQNDEELHSFRVKNKKLRFVLELLAEEGKKAKRGVLLAERAELVRQVHTALGNLSDLLVLRNTLRLARAHWAGSPTPLHASAAALEDARLKLEASEFNQWFQLWPALSSPHFLEGLG